MKEFKEFKNLKEIIYNSVEKYGNDVAFTIKENKEKKEYINITYKNFLEHINALGTQLFSMGFKEKRIAIIGRNRYEWALAYVTSLMGGICAVPLDKDLPIEELESSLIRSKADVIIFDEKYIDKINDIEKKKSTNIKEYISMGSLEGKENLWQLIKKGENEIIKGVREYLDAKIDSFKMNILLFTSGTTSKSKAVMLSQNNIATDIYGMQIAEQFENNHVNLALLPFHHIFGSTGLLTMLACGIKTTFPDGLRYISQNLKEYKVSFFIGVPILIETMYKKVLKGIKDKGKEKSVKFGIALSKFLMIFKIDIRRKLFKQIIDELGGAMRFIVSGGAPLDPKVQKGFNDLGIELVQGYGLTETAPVICAEDGIHKRIGSIGKPMPNMEVKIIDPDSSGMGEIAVKGPNVMLGYYENEEITKEVLKDGWFYTGDLGRIDKDGYVFITGRKKDMIVLKNGKKVFPEEVETLVNRIDIVKESMVFGLPEDNDKNDVKLSVKVVYDKDIAKSNYSGKSEEELRELVWNKIKEINKTMPQYKYIKNMIFTDEELIKTNTQKIKRHEEMKKIRY